jgi:serine/threonine-protein kinase
MRYQRPPLFLTAFVLGGFVLFVLVFPAIVIEDARPTGAENGAMLGHPPARGVPTGSATVAIVASPTGEELIVVPAGVVETSANPLGRVTDDAMVFIDAFLIARTEVMNAAFAEFVRETGYVTLAERRGDVRTWRTQSGPETEAHPVTFIAWADAHAYCVHVGLRLPTEQEWERAARGDDARLWPWGHVWDGDNLNSLERGATDPSPVGSYPQGASPFGVLDLAGNVWEWTSSSYLTEAQQAAPDAGVAQVFEGHRVLRGGSWRTMAPGTQTTYRKPAPLDYWRDTTGFRCAGDTAVGGGG